MRARLRPVCMETHVWIATKRYSPFQQSEERILGLEGETLTVRGEGGTWSSSLSEIELRFPRSMLGAGFELIVGGGKLYFWFYDPFTGRDAMLEGSDQDEATIETPRASSRAGSRQALVAGAPHRCLTAAPSDTGPASSSGGGRRFDARGTPASDSGSPRQMRHIPRAAANTTTARMARRSLPRSSPHPRRRSYSARRL
jgi:hypothetical protein